MNLTCGIILQITLFIKNFPDVMQCTKHFVSSCNSQFYHYSYSMGEVIRQDVKKLFQLSSGNRLCIVFLCSDAQLCMTLCNHTDHSPPGSSVHGILQARILIQGSNLCLLCLLYGQVDSLPLVLPEMNRYKSKQSNMHVLLLNYTINYLIILFVVCEIKSSQKPF